MSKEKNLVKNIMILLFGTVIPKLTSLLTLPIITAMLTKSELGSYDIVLSTGAMLLPIVLMQLQAAGFRFLITTEGDKSKQKEIISNISCFVMGSMSLVATFTYIFLKCVINAETTLIVCILIYLVTDAVINTLKQFARGLKSTKIYSSSTIVNSFIELGLVFVLLYIGEMGLLGAVISLAIGQISASIFIIYKLQIMTYIDFGYFSKKRIKEYLNYSWPLVPSAFSSWITLSADKMIITAFMGLEWVGINAIAVKLPNMFLYAQSAFSLAWQESATLSINDDDASQYYSDVFEKVLNILVAIMALLITASPIIFSLLIKGDYDAAYGPMSVRFIASIFSSLSAYLGGIYVAHMKSKEMAVSTVLCSILSLTLNFILIRFIGLYAAAIASLLSYMSLSIYRMKDIQKIQKIKFNLKIIFFYLSILMIMAYFCSLRTFVANIVNCAIAIPLVIVPNKYLLTALLVKIKRINK